MGFTTPVFLFFFLPLAAAVWGLCRLLERFPLWKRARLGDWAAVGLSLAFYAWARFDGVFWLCGFILAVFAAARLFQAARGWRLVLPLRRGEDGPLLCPPLRPVLFAAGVCAALGCLFYYKYLGFAAGIWNSLSGGSAAAPAPAVPLGVSFLTFSAVSYLADAYRGTAGAGSLLDCALYLSFFPKAVSGPIVLWKDFQPQIAGRRADLDGFCAGVERICLGFAKKLILADMFGARIAEIDAAAAASGVDAPTAWLAALFYMFQIYYDFAGYSDIAIGLGRMMGFHFRENFNFPYRSRSVTEFWRRWHISLGTWFREYVYIPLGGGRRGLGRTLRNLAVVFALTGVWHGAGWNYILWGGINGACVLFERAARDRPWYKKTPEALKWAGTLFTAFLFWELFRFQSLGELWNWLKIMLGLARFEAPTFTWRYFLNARMAVLTAAAALGAVAPDLERVRRGWGRLTEKRGGLALQEAALLLAFVLSVLCMVNSTYYPFIYFQY